MLDQRQLESYIQNFYGYGSWNAPIVFIGPEEGGGENVEELQRRLDAHVFYNSSELVDVKGFHVRLPYAFGGRWFENGGTIQSTWARLCRIAIAFKSPEAAGFITKEQVLEYQLTRLGSATLGETCLIEASTLPCPNAAAWRYADASNVQYMASREAFEQYFNDNVRPNRVKRISSALSSPLSDGHRRIAVVYGRRECSKRLVEDLTGKASGDDRITLGKSPIDIYEQDPFALLWIHHPVSGQMNSYFERVGVEAARLARRQLLPVEAEDDRMSTRSEQMAYTVYWNKWNKHVLIHRSDCGHINKHGGEQKYEQEGYGHFNILRDAVEFARSKAAEIHTEAVGPCTFCKPAVREISLETAAKAESRKDRALESEAPQL